MKPKLDPRIYTRAAELIDGGERYPHVTGCCEALHEVGDSGRTHIEFFAKLFKEDAVDATGFIIYWFGRGREQTPHRVLSLLLAAAIVADQDNPRPSPRRQRKTTK